MFYVLRQDFSYIRDLDQTGKNGFHAIPNVNKLAQQTPAPFKVGLKWPRNWTQKLCSVKNDDKDLHSQQYFCMSDLGLDFKGLKFKRLRFKGFSFKGFIFKGLGFKGLRFEGLGFKEFRFKRLISKRLSIKELKFKGIWI